MKILIKNSCGRNDGDEDVTIILINKDHVLPVKRYGAPRECQQNRDYPRAFKFDSFLR